jgi:hypothetical protein
MLRRSWFFYFIKFRLAKAAKRRSWVFLLYQERKGLPLVFDKIRQRWLIESGVPSLKLAVVWTFSAVADLEGIHDTSYPSGGHCLCYIPPSPHPSSNSAPSTRESDEVGGGGEAGVIGQPPNERQTLIAYKGARALRT